MNLKNDWKIISEVNDLDIKIFTNINNDNEFVIRDTNDTGALASLIISDSDIEIQEISWAISLRIDWMNKQLFIKESSEKKND